MRVARQRGIRTVCTNVVAENIAFLAFIRSLALTYNVEVSCGELMLFIQLPAR